MAPANALSPSGNGFHPMQVRAHQNRALLLPSLLFVQGDVNYLMLAPVAQPLAQKSRDMESKKSRQVQIHEHHLKTLQRLG